MGDNSPITQWPLPAYDGETAGRHGAGIVCTEIHTILIQREIPSDLFYLVSLSFRLFRCLSQKGLNCRLAERDTFIITIIQNAMMEGRIQKTTFQGDAIVESLDPDTVTKLLHYLELTSQAGHIPWRYKQVTACLYFFQFEFWYNCQVFLCGYLCLIWSCFITPVVSGTRFHHAGREEEPSRQRALPISGPCWGYFGGHWSVPHEEAGEDDQKRISAEVTLYLQVHSVCFKFKVVLFL